MTWECVENNNKTTFQYQRNNLGLPIAIATTDLWKYTKVEINVWQLRLKAKIINLNPIFVNKNYTLIPEE